MRAACISIENCQYKTDTGYCGYTGNGCAQNFVHSVRIDESQYTTVEKAKVLDDIKVNISDEVIEKIADAVVKKLEEKWENGHNYILDPNFTQRKLF